MIAKRLDGAYLPGKREMVKVKHARDADCVAIGYRIHKSGEGVGSILLGLYRDDGELQMIGGASSFTAKDRLRTAGRLEPLRKGDDVVHEGEPSRWNSAADKRWIPVRPEKVAEVAYDQMEGDAAAHAGAAFVRWRPDRDAASCTLRPARGARCATTSSDVLAWTVVSPKVPAEELDVDGIAVRLTNPDKVYFPSSGRRRHQAAPRRVLPRGRAAGRSCARCATGRRICSGSRTGSRARRSTRSGCRSTIPSTAEVPR